MLIPTNLPKITHEDVQNVDLYHDFILYLTHLHQKPIKRTATGNISLADIKHLLPLLKTTQATIKEHQKYQWSLRSEYHLRTLTQIKIIAHTLRLTQNRKGYIHLTKNGTRFLTTLSPLKQYEQLTLTYWQQVNWDYFSSSHQIDEDTLCTILQDNQTSIWQFLLQKGQNWTDYLTFARSLSDYFHLHQFLPQEHPEISDHSRYYDLELDLFTHNLTLLGCVQTETKPYEDNLHPHLTRFRPTPLGLLAFNLALYRTGCKTLIHE